MSSSIALETFMIHVVSIKVFQFMLFKGGFEPILGSCNIEM